MDANDAPLADRLAAGPPSDESITEDTRLGAVVVYHNRFLWKLLTIAVLATCFLTAAGVPAIRSLIPTILSFVILWSLFDLSNLLQWLGAGRLVCFVLLVVFPIGAIVALAWSIHQGRTAGLPLDWTGFYRLSKLLPPNQP